MPASVTSEFEVAYNKNHRETGMESVKKQVWGKCTFLEELCYIRIEGRLLR